MNFEQFHEWILKNMGINLSAYKPVQLHRRINSLMIRLNIGSLKEYTEILKNDQEQRQRFLDFITINVTEFFRNPNLFDDLEILFKNELNASNRQLSIWSAACSKGCEPYSVAIILDKINPYMNHKILGTDLDNTILHSAKVGIYQKDEIKNINNQDRYKYFKEIDEKYYISDNIKKMVCFKKHDLIMDEYEGLFDVILCRNVVIYFNEETKNKIYRKFYDCLKNGGYLFVGATESIYDYKKYGFEKYSTFIYKKNI